MSIGDFLTKYNYTNRNYSISNMHHLSMHFTKQIQLMQFNNLPYKCINNHYDHQDHCMGYSNLTLEKKNASD